MNMVQWPKAPAYPKGNKLLCLFCFHLQPYVIIMQTNLSQFAEADQFIRLMKPMKVPRLTKGVCKEQLVKDKTKVLELSGTSSWELEEDQRFILWDYTHGTDGQLKWRSRNQMNQTLWEAAEGIYIPSRWRTRVLDNWNLTSADDSGCSVHKQEARAFLQHTNPDSRTNYPFSTIPTLERSYGTHLVIARCVGRANALKICWRSIHLW